MESQDVKLSSNSQKRYFEGLIAALSCSTLWGILPIYWQSLRPIPSEVIILYRVFLMALMCLGGSLYIYGYKKIMEPIKTRRKDIFLHILAGLLITANWSLYIWAVNANYVIQTAMGYFLEPLVVSVIGVIVFKETLNKPKKVALTLAFVGIGVMVVGYRQLPLIALGLAGTFSIYAAMKKNLHTPPMLSLLYETILLMPVALFFIFTFEGALPVKGSGMTSKYVLLLLSGLMTAVPMGLFSYAAPRLPLVTLGLTEYLSPSISLILGIFLFKEPFDKIQFTAFIFIWIALVFFTVGEWRDVKDNKIKTDSP